MYCDRNADHCRDLQLTEDLHFFNILTGHNDVFFKTRLTSSTNCFFLNKANFWDLLQQQEKYLIPNWCFNSVQTRIGTEWTQESLYDDWKAQGEDEPLELVCRRSEPAGETWDLVIHVLLWSGQTHVLLAHKIDTTIVTYNSQFSVLFRLMEFFHIRLFSFWLEL